MVDAKKELGQIAKSLAVLTKRTEKLAGQLDKLEKTRRQGSKQGRPSKPKQKETSKKTVATKKDKRVTAIDTVLDIIKKRKAGVDYPPAVCYTIIISAQGERLDRTCA